MPPLGSDTPTPVHPERAGYGQRSSPGGRSPIDTVDENGRWVTWDTQLSADPSSVPSILIETLTHNQPAIGSWPVPRLFGGTLGPPMGMGLAVQPGQSPMPVRVGANPVSFALCMRAIASGAQTSQFGTGFKCHSNIILHLKVMDNWAQFACV